MKIRTLASIAALVALALRAPALAQTLVGVTITAPVAVSAVAPDRAALIVATGHATPARADALRYRDLLQRLGFDVTLVVTDTRPELKNAFRAFASRVKAGGDAAVFVLGALLPKGDDLYVVASDTNTPLDLYATEGLRLADALKPVVGAGARDIVLFVDECQGAKGQACHIGTGTVPEGVSAIVGERLEPERSGAPIAGIASLSQELLPLMQREGLSDLALFGALKESLAGTNMTVAASPSLTRSFSFLPAGYLAGLATPCNRVDPTADADHLKNGAPVDALVPECVRAATTWAFSPWFKDKLTAAREQAAFQAAANGCHPSPIRAYLEGYPGGRYVSAVRAIADQCDAERRRAEAPPPPPPVAEAEPAASAPPPEVTKEASMCTVGGLDPAGNNWLALRERPSYQSSWSTTRMGPGTVASLFGRSGDWVHIRLMSGESGWANGKFLFCGTTTPAREVAEAPPAQSGCVVAGLDPNGDNWLALRSSPNPKAPWSQRHMGPGTPLVVFGNSGPWLHVRLSSGETGWAYSQYVRCDR